MAAYARNELGFKTEMTYVLLARDVTGNGTGKAAGYRPARKTICACCSPSARHSAC